MPRPKTKDELLPLSQANFDKLMSYIETLSDSEQTAEFKPGTMNRNIRDVLAHLHHWHIMMETWYNEGMKGAKPAMPAEGYTWKTVPTLNRKIWEAYSDKPLIEVVKKFKDSHAALHFIMNKHSNEELFEKKRYKWTGSTSLGAYLISATSSHYDWAFKLIKKARTTS